tara:strand:+ start:398 stop:499 length:102 start_codon:yes stop_codon:yes gene_type:complete
MTHEVALHQNQNILINNPKLLEKLGLMCLKPVN